MKRRHTDILIVGGGSGGFGAALRSARENPQARVTLIEAMDGLGGTSTLGGVNNWEPGIAGLGAHNELFNRLKAVPGAIGVGKTTHKYTSKEEPFGLSEVDPGLEYESSLRRSALEKDLWRRVHFEPEVMSRVMEELLLETGRVDILYRTRFVEVHTEGERIRSVVIQTEGDPEPVEICASYFIDCSGGVHLARAAGCKTAFGEDSASMYGEPSAPEAASLTVNGVSQIYRVQRLAEPVAETLPDHPYVQEAEQWIKDKHPVTFIATYPNGDFNMNVLPVFEGQYFHSLPYGQAKEMGTIRALVHWHWLKRLCPAYFGSFRFQMAFPLVGIRESHRLVGRYVLKEQDVRNGLMCQERQDELIAFADHALDTHGRTAVKGANLKELPQPYGIPYSCLLAKEFVNLAVASRGASFSHIAASSCRLSRTMMDLGEAAGTGAALALQEGTGLGDIQIQELRKRLRIDELRERIIRSWNL
ncbi:FAD-dependent oxidoreductase [Paenibacillus thalictri]|uniref:FAD-dependent oxidoreductase n=1 Tax=Paenibacillus thalictri TaxID=2527873 RepID=A0A4Q9DQI5_9BACL|nr:FAD-dependent oxidoreductase [Paenibacillus thalictri]TBL76356.1 FAD-dependent oxidoreductase [Paenibacillus thalictri]